MAGKGDYQLNQLSDDSKYEIRQMLIHKNGGTIIDIEDLGDCLEAFGFSPDDEDTEFLKKHMDDNGDGRLEVDELIANIDVIHFHCYYGKDLMKAWGKIDNDGDGIIRMPEMLKYLTTRKRDPMEVQKARRLLDVLARKFDENFDGKFSYTEFVKIYMSDMLPFRKHLEAGGSVSDDEEVVQIGKNGQISDDKLKKKRLPRRKTDQGMSGLSEPSSGSGLTSDGRGRPPPRRHTMPSSMTGSGSGQAEVKTVSSVRMTDIYGRPRTAAATRSIKARMRKKPPATTT